MYEYSSVSASSYDPGALVAKLNEAAADGWDVVSIVPTGGDVSAFLRRDLDAELEAAVVEEALVEEAIVDEAILDEAEAEVAAEEALVEEEAAVDDALVEEAAVEEEAAEEAAVEEEAVEEAAAASTTGGWGDDSAGNGEATAVIEVTEVAEVTEAPPVEEPAGWAVAPDGGTGDSGSGDSGTTDTAAEEIPLVATGTAVAAEPSPAPAPEPAPAPVPEPAPVVTTPAGWYPDPSTRYELRYWDGTQWTEHVARQGQQFTDPPVR